MMLAVGHVLFAWAALAGTIVAIGKLNGEPVWPRARRTAEGR